LAFTDPIGEPGFENLRATGAMPKIGRVTNPISLTLSRWINRDPIVEAKEPNRFVFVNNSPIQKIDVHGLGIANYPQYGNYCGAGYCGGKVLKRCDVCDFNVPAKNPMDSCCKDHDKCYDDAKGDKTKLHACDQNLCECLKNNVDT
jgi:RHS repeat-associated protein